MNSDVKKFFVHEEVCIKETLEIIDKGVRGIALVVDDDNRLIGTITDGDIRRAILKGASLEAPIQHICNKNCKYVHEDYDEEKIKRTMIKENIKLIPIVNNEKIVIDYLEIENLFNLEKGWKDNPVLIMAGGLGSRLKPLTDDIPKPMLKVGEKPILETIINGFRIRGFHNIFISINYKGDIIENYFRDGSDFGVNINYIKEHKRMGTAGAIKFAEKNLDKTFFVINGDILTNVNFESIINYHKENSCRMTIASRKYEMQVPYGVINVDENRVTDLEEKPMVSCLINAGVYVLNPEVIKYIPEDSYFDITELISIILKNNYKVGTFPIEDYWMDIGKHEDYIRANVDIKKYFN